jgi:hypothetical protein
MLFSLLSLKKGGARGSVRRVTYQAKYEGLQELAQLLRILLLETVWKIAGQVWIAWFW